MENFTYHKEDDLNAWNGIKCLLHHVRRIPNFSEREIWWYNCGENVGIEINGKNEEFTRPVLIYHKFNKYSFLGIPLTSREHSGSWYIHFWLHGRKNYAVLCQIRVYDARRLQRRIGKIDEQDFQQITTGFTNLYIKNTLPS